MGNRRTERTALGALHIYVNPLVVAGRIRELVDALLRYDDPVADSDFLAH